ncbi:P-II family nitrogen regulator [Solilutibacter silvestris]|uniref:P-II family nitrogen regulator n=1 Tax=Solilutibacter silvestris TaxID=1645665 RepID=UPI003D34ACD2
MKQLKAFVHRNRVADLVHVLDAAGFRRVSLFDVKALLRVLSAREQEYSVELGDKVISEVQIEVFCEDDEVARATELIRQTGRTGHRDGGWLYISAVEQALPIDGTA